AALGAAWPGSLPVADLAAADEAPTVRQALLAGAAAGLVTLTAYAPPVATAAGERPLASPFARFQAARGDEGVTTLRHEHVRFGDEMAGELFALLDGTRDRASLVAAMRERGAGADAPRRLEASLARLADLALLVRG
ncbi:MAG: hypothetical protein QOJ07_620, partial [Thermoleophilaceae bacterium]|nr:hypothetical protein [Thermoleophilaceae bacterium]